MQDGEFCGGFASEEPECLFIMLIFRTMIVVLAAGTHAWDFS